MSNDASTATSQTPRQEALDRTLEAFPAAFLPRLISVGFLRDMLSDARDRVKDSHRAQMAALGQEATESEDVGGINVQGDTTNHIHVAAPIAAAAKSGLLKKLLPYAMAVCLGGGIAGLAPLAYQWWSNRGGEKEFEIRFFDKDGNQITVPRLPK
jgi:hypothetical protein